jgi:hypothetical protein
MKFIGTDDVVDETHIDEPLPYVDLAADLKLRPWLIPERIPKRNVTLLSGEGAMVSPRC